MVFHLRWISHHSSPITTLVARDFSEIRRIVVRKIHFTWKTMQKRISGIVNRRGGYMILLFIYRRGVVVYMILLFIYRRGAEVHMMLDYSKCKTSCIKSADSAAEFTSKSLMDGWIPNAAIYQVECELYAEIFS